MCRSLAAADTAAGGRNAAGRRAHYGAPGREGGAAAHRLIATKDDRQPIKGGVTPSPSRDVR